MQTIKMELKSFEIVIAVHLQDYFSFFSQFSAPILLPSVRDCYFVSGDGNGVMDALILGLYIIFTLRCGT